MSVSSDTRSRAVSYTHLDVYKRQALADALAASVRGEQEAPEQAVADAPKAKGFICKICGFIYESDTLPEDFRCPICGRPASDFEPVT